MNPLCALINGFLYIPIAVKAMSLALLANASYSCPVVVNPMTEFDSSIHKRRTSALWRHFFVRNALGAPFMGGPGGEPHGSPVSFCAGLSTRPVPSTRLTAGAEFKTAQKENIMATHALSSSVSSDSLASILGAREARAVYKALRIIENTFIREDSPVFSSPSAVRAYLRCRLGGLDKESFLVLFLDNANRLIAAEIMFTGTINATSVYPREVVRRALQLNAASLIVAHNHPSGSIKPSLADIELTQRLKSVLALVDITLLDHFIVTSETAVSMADKGLV